jgi:hypothetical protein
MVELCRIYIVESCTVDKIEGKCQFIVYLGKIFKESRIKIPLTIGKGA